MPFDTSKRLDQTTPRAAPPVPNPPLPEEGSDGARSLPQTRPGVTSPDGVPVISVGLSAAYTPDRRYERASGRLPARSDRRGGL